MDRTRETARLQTFLVEEFPDAHIRMIASYDANAKERGWVDIHDVIEESLLS